MTAAWLQIALLVLALLSLPSEVRGSSRGLVALAYCAPIVLALAAVAVWIVDRCVP